MIWIGCDPGLSGAIAWIGDTMGVSDTPTVKVKKGRREIDDDAMVQLIASIIGQGEAFAVVEKISALPHAMRAGNASLSLGTSFGIVRGVLAGLAIPREMVTPQRWKKTMLEGTDKSKGAAILVAKRLFPALEARLLKSKDGRAEALLLAEYGRRIHGGGGTR